MVISTAKENNNGRVFYEETLSRETLKKQSWVELTES